MILCAKHWREILTVQHFISGVILFLMIEMAFNWGYWDDYNKTGESCKSNIVGSPLWYAYRSSFCLHMI